jgi:hypothetical protein
MHNLLGEMTKETPSIVGVLTEQLFISQDRLHFHGMSYFIWFSILLQLYYSIQY